MTEWGVSCWLSTFLYKDKLLNSEEYSMNEKLDLSLHIRKQISSCLSVRVQTV